MDAPTNHHIWSGDFLDGKLHIYQDSSVSQRFYFSVENAAGELFQGSAITREIPTAENAGGVMCELRAVIQEYYQQKLMEIAKNVTRQ